MVGNRVTISAGDAQPVVSLTHEGLDNGGNRITHVRSGVAPTDAVNLSQLQEVGRVVAEVANDAQNQGAMGAALAGLKPLQYDLIEPTQIMAAVGSYRNTQAVALGLAHYTNEETMLHAGMSMGRGDNMFNLGVSHKFGHGSEKKAIPERYQAGPISSVYVMQDEVTALKEENATLRANVEQLQRDNEETKAMLAQVLAALAQK